MVRPSKHPISAADGRPRIFIEVGDDCFWWRIGATSNPRPAANMGDAVEEAMGRVHWQPAVIIYGPVFQESEA